ncbi:MAG: BON domain-containing protein [Acidobacteria bacterium]|nr:BON domain-containing protein [Acidobacteriota bacterium]
MRIRKLIGSVLAIASVFLIMGAARAQLAETFFQSQPGSMIVQSKPKSVRARKAPRPQPQETSAQTSARTLDQMVSNDVVAYIEIRDMRAQVESLRLIDITKSFWPLLASTLKLAPEKGAVLETVWTMMAPSLQGAQLSVAVWPNEAGISTGQKRRQEPSIGVFMKFASTDQLRQFMQRREEIERSLRTLSGEKSDKTKVELSFTTIDDVLVIGETNVVERALRSGASARKLADEADFRVARARYADTPMFLYADLTRAAKMAEPGERKAGTGEKEQGVNPAEIASLKGLVDLEQLPKLAAGVRFQETHTIIQALLLEKRSGANSARSLSSLFNPAEASLRAAQWQPSQADASLTLAPDWQALYDAIVPPLEKLFFSKEGQGTSPIPMIEAMIGYKIRDQLLPALGSVSVSFDSIESVMPSKGDSKDKSSPPELTVLVALRNREVVEGVLKNVQRLLPPGMAAGTGGEEDAASPISRLGGWGYAFVDGVLALSSDPGNLRELVKGQSSTRTLATSPDFVRATQWMPQQLVAWAYVSPSATQQLFESLRQEATKDEPQLASVLARFSPQIQPISLASWREDVGLAVELRAPEGTLPILIASALASKRAEERDKAINEKAVAVLAGKPDLASVDVSIKGGVVTLTGTVKTESAKSLAQQLMEKIEGVKSVINEIEVEPEQ